MVTTAPQRGRVRIGLFGEFGVGNIGNDASLDSMLRILKRTQPDADLLCICRGPDYVTANVGIPSTPMSWYAAIGSRWRWLPSKPGRVIGKVADLARTVSLLRRLDVLIIPGTGLFEEFGVSPWKMPLTLARVGLTARLCRTKLMLVSVGAEPIVNATSARLMRWAAQGATYRSYRDQLSHHSMAAMGVDVSPDRVFSDLAFSLEPIDDQDDRAAGTTAPVGVGVMSYYGRSSSPLERAGRHARYLQTMVGFVSWLLDQGRPVRLLTADTADVPAAEQVRDRVVARHGRRAVDISLAAAADIEELQRATADTSVVVATRYHQLIAAFLQGKPTISIQYAEKNRQLMRDADADGFCQLAESVDLDRLIDQFRTLESRADQQAELIRQAAQGYRSLLRDQEPLIEHVLAARPEA